jgi:hypothetical protein
MQRCVTLSVTEAELVSATTCAKDMLFVMQLLESNGLKVKKPIIHKVDNKGAKDHLENCSVAGRTQIVDVCEYFLRNLKEDGVICVHLIPTNESSSDLFTKTWQDRCLKNMLQFTVELMNICNIVRILMNLVG